MEDGDVVPENGQTITYTVQPQAALTVIDVMIDNFCIQTRFDIGTPVCNRRVCRRKFQIGYAIRNPSKRQRFVPVLIGQSRCAVCGIFAILQPCRMGRF